MKQAALFPILLTFLVLLSCGQRDLKTRRVAFYENTGKTEAPGAPLALENEYLVFEFLPETAGFTLTEKAAGTVWRSNPPPDDPGADPVTKQLMASQFALQYADGAGVGQTLYSGRHSVERGTWDYALAEGGLELRHTVSNSARTYILPPAAGEERMLGFLERMERGGRRKVETGYRLYDIENLRAGEDRNAVLALYPELAKEKVYVLRENTQEYQRAQFEEYFAAAGYTYEDYLADTAKYPQAEGEEKPAFSLTIRYELDGNSLVVSLPFDSIAYRPAYPLTQVSLLPFLGAGGLEDEGCLLVPDGSGALINFNNGKQSQIAYNNNIYGWDEAMPRDAVINDNKAPYPVFGIQKNSAALLCVIEEGAAYGNIRADVSGRNCSWNSVYAQFTLVHGATMDISGRSDRAVYQFETEPPPGERIALRYIPCARDGYVGMAQEYRRYLLGRSGGLWPEGNAGAGRAELPVAVEIVGAVSKTQHRLGFPVELPLKLTSFAEAEGMIRDFAAFGWENPQIKLAGWFNGSVDHAVPSRIRLIRELGGKKGFAGLVKAAEESGASLYGEADFLYMRDNSAFDGFSLYADAARYVNRERVQSYPYSFVWFGERERWGKLSYLARPAFMTGLIDGFVKQAGALGLDNLALRSAGAKLAGDYHEKRRVSREASMNLQREKLSELRAAGKGLMINTGYVYAAPYASVITDLALSDQGFGLTDTPVPFYQIALHGLVPYTGRAINLAEDYTKNLLKTIETGAGLYFSFMSAETAELQETKFRQFYANEYGKWAADADKLYQRFRRDFGGLFQEAIENHETLAPGVTVTEYGNGTKVVVNAGDAPWEYNGAVIGADDYLVVE